MSDDSRNSSPSNNKDLFEEASAPDESSMSAQELNHSQSSDGDNASDTEYDPAILAAIEASREEAETEYADPEIAAALAASMKENEQTEEDRHVTDNETNDISDTEKDIEINEDSQNSKENSQIENSNNDINNSEVKDNSSNNLSESYDEVDKGIENKEENGEVKTKGKSLKTDENNLEGNEEMDDKEENKEPDEKSKNKDPENKEENEEPNEKAENEQSNDKSENDETDEKEDDELKQDGEIELEGDPEIDENPFEEQDASNPLGEDEYDPLNEDSEDSDDKKEDDDYDPLNDFRETMDGEEENEENGFLDKVNSGKLILKKSNGSAKKKRANPVYITPIKKARKRSYSNSSNEDDIPEGDSDFMPGSKKSRTTPRKPKKTRPKRSPKKLEVLFKCTICTFNSEILGELNIHKHSSHKNQKKPSYLDMAEVVIGKLNDKSGSNKTNILKEMMSDHYELIPEDKNKASQMLSRALSGGVHLGRLRETKKGGKGAANYWIVSKEKRKIVLENWKKDKRTVEQKDSPGVVEGSKEFLEIKEKLTKYNIQMTTAPKSTSVQPDTKNYGRGKRDSKPPQMGSVISHGDNSDDDEIAILEEKITPKTKMRLLHKKKIIAKGGGGAKTVIRVNSAQGKQLLRKIASTGSVPKSASMVTKTAVKKDDDDSDDDSQLTCSICMSSFWYANQTYEHMKSAHSIENPEKFIKDRLKK